METFPAGTEITDKTSNHWNPINWTINRSINQSIDQSINQSIDRSINAIDQSINQWYFLCVFYSLYSEFFISIFPFFIICFSLLHGYFWFILCFLVWWSVLLHTMLCCWKKDKMSYDNKAIRTVYGGHHVLGGKCDGTIQCLFNRTGLRGRGPYEDIRYFQGPGLELWALSTIRCVGAFPPTGSVLIPGIPTADTLTQLPTICSCLQIFTSKTWNKKMNNNPYTDTQSPPPARFTPSPSPSPASPPPSQRSHYFSHHPNGAENYQNPKTSTTQGENWLIDWLGVLKMTPDW